MTVLAATWCYVLLAWALLELGLRAWAAPCRIVGLPAGPMAGALPVRIEPGEVTWQAAAGPPEPGMVPRVSATGEAFWSAMELAVVDPVHVGATEEWSPKHAAAEAERGMLPLDDVDEWLAGRLSEYGHALIRIGTRRVSLVRGETQCTMDEELERFQQGSMSMHAYRSMILDSTGGYTMREAAEVEALLLATA